MVLWLFCNIIYTRKQILELAEAEGGSPKLHGLDERDKHHFVLTIGEAIKVSLADLSTIIPLDRMPKIPLETIVSTIGPFAVDLCDGDFDRTNFPEFERKAAFDPAFTIAFGNDETLQGEPVIEALRSITDATVNAVDRLARAFLQ